MTYVDMSSSLVNIVELLADMGFKEVPNPYRGGGVHLTRNTGDPITAITVADADGYKILFSVEFDLDSPKVANAIQGEDFPIDLYRQWGDDLFINGVDGDTVKGAFGYKITTTDEYVSPNEIIEDVFQYGEDVLRFVNDRYISSL